MICWVLRALEKALGQDMRESDHVMLILDRSSQRTASGEGQLRARLLLPGNAHAPGCCLNPVAHAPPAGQSLRESERAHEHRAEREGQARPGTRQ